MSFRMTTARLLFLISWVPTVCAWVMLLIVVPPVNAVEAANPVDIREWQVPYGGRPRDPFAAGADEIWLVGQTGHYLARFTPSTGVFIKHDLPGRSGPHNLIVGSDGIVWYAGNRKGYIGRFDPRTDTFEKIVMPDQKARDPHTLVFDASERHIWFTAQNGNFVGRLVIESRSVDLIPVATPAARPYGIKVAPDGTPWIVLLGTNKLAAVDPETLELLEIALPATGARPRRLEITVDGRIWYADYGRGFLGLYDPGSQTFQEWVLPSGRNSRPYGMASDETGRVWLVETGVSPNLFVGFDTHAERIVSITPIPSGAGSVRHMDYHRPSGTVWFATDEATVGRAVVRQSDTK